jgi:hypothetical protein
MASREFHCISPTEPMRFLTLGGRITRRGFCRVVGKSGRLFRQRSASTVRAIGGDIKGNDASKHIIKPAIMPRDMI